MNTTKTLSPVETLVTGGFELEAMSSLGLALVKTDAGLGIEWTGTFSGACRAPVANVAEARAWVRRNWRLFTGVTS